MRVAIAHDYLTQRGGAERVVLAMARAFPDAPIYTSLYDESGTFPEFADLDVRPSVLQRVPLFRSHHRLALPLYAPVFSRMTIDADVVLCSSSGWAHGVRVAGDGRKVVYCYNPPRWLYQLDQYVPQRSLRRIAGRVLGSPLRAWDQRAARAAAVYLTSSRVVAERIRTTYGRDADVIPPPPAVTPDGEHQAVPAIEPGYVLCVSRLLPYKNLTAVVDAFRNLADERLVLIGDGPERDALTRRAPDNVRMIRKVSDGQLRWLYASASLLVAASYEDYGLTPLEAATFGKPSAVLRWGGFLDTMNDTTAVFFAEPEPEAIVRSVAHARGRAWSEDDIRRHSAAFGAAAFEEALQRSVYAVRAAARPEAAA
jgi:glycosyltransferase involved in cell wall biosynthesis